MAEYEPKDVGDM